MKINLYHLLSRRNDLRSLLRGRLPQRLIRKVVYRHVFRASSFITRLLGVSR
jgi:hypothetical protein